MPPSLLMSCFLSEGSVFAAFRDGEMWPVRLWRPSPESDSAQVDARQASREHQGCLWQPDPSLQLSAHCPGTSTSKQANSKEMGTRVNV